MKKRLFTLIFMLCLVCTGLTASPALAEQAQADIAELTTIARTAANTLLDELYDNYFSYYTAEELRLRVRAEYASSRQARAPYYDKFRVQNWKKRRRPYTRRCAAHASHQDRPGKDMLSKEIYVLSLRLFPRARR